MAARRLPTLTGRVMFAGEEFCDLAKASERPRECDLVMKGGITSGVVYPKAVLKLRDAGYRFRNIGGTSVGAIAATIVAASQYGALTSDRDGSGFAALEKLSREITTPRFIRNLFQPIGGASDGFYMLLPLVTGKETRFRRLLGVIGMALRKRAWVSLIAAIVFAGYAVLLGLAWGRAHDSVIAVVALTLGAGPAVVVLIVVVVAVAARLLRRPTLIVGGMMLALLAVAALALDALALAGVDGATLARAGFVASGVVAALYLAALAALASAALILYALKTAIEGDFFGICRGKPGLTEWLYGLIQEGAGRDRSAPLTFADLEKQEVSLEMVTTDLSYGRPVTLPLDGDTYLFDLDEWRCFFPDEVIDELAKIPATDVTCPRNPQHKLRPLPGRDLPVIVGARLSLSYPMLLSALPLYSVVKGDTGFLEEPDRRLVIVHWFSDGGISSNFPIHFFDSWVPGRPTFGLDLQPYPDTRLAQRLPPLDSAPVYMPRSPLEQSLPHWSTVDGIGGFFRQIFDAARNWRDALQGEIPGSRERICHVRLNRDEGGLNLEIDPTVVGDLLSRGADAGQAIVDNFDWPQHRFTRYLTLMSLLERNLVESNEATRFPDFAVSLREGDFPYYRQGHDVDWCNAAAELTESLLSDAGGWSVGPAPAGGFGAGDQPSPPPQFKVVPRG